MCGISGSGKSTRIKNFYPYAKVFSADHFFIRKNEDNEEVYDFDPKLLGEAHNRCLEEFVDTLYEWNEYGCPERYKGLIVIDNTNTSILEITPYAQLALAYRCELVIEIINCEIKTAIARNVHNVPAKVINGQARKLEQMLKYKQMPKWWEVSQIFEKDKYTCSDKYETNDNINEWINGELTVYNNPTFKSTDGKENTKCSGEINKA